MSNTSEASSGANNPSDNHMLSTLERRHRLRELSRLFLKLGTLAFGGPAAHIAMMEDEVVARRQWMTRQQLLDLLGVTNLIPGPNSTELAIHIGYSRAGWPGLMVAGACFIFPAMLIVLGLAVVYVRWHTLPQVTWLLYGIKPVIIAIVVQALWRLGRTVVKNIPTGVTGGGVILLALVGWHEILLLFMAGLGLMLGQGWRRLSARQSLLTFTLPLQGLTALWASPSVALATPVSLLKLFGFFLKIGSVLYGSGYVLLAFLQSDLVERWHWLTSQQLLDAVAIGQVTPGPVFTTATFIGYLLGGTPGALVATVGIFLPAFVFVAAVNPWVPTLRQSPWASGFLDGVNAASMGLMAVVTWKLASAAINDWVTLALALLSGVGVFYYKVNATWLVAAGGMIGLLVHLWS